MSNPRARTLLALCADRARMPPGCGNPSGTRHGRDSGNHQDRRWLRVHRLIESQHATLGAAGAPKRAAAVTPLIGVILHVNPARNGAALFTAARQPLNWGFQRV